MDHATHERPPASGGLLARRAASERYKPDRVRLLLVAEAPPSDEDRYFYFPRVPTQDSLFWSVVEAIYGATLDRDRKPGWLRRLGSDGVFLIDLSMEPLPKRQRSARVLRPHVPGLVERSRALRPEAIILIKAPVYDVAFLALQTDGLPVVDRRIPFPGSGQQKRFHTEFSRALRSAGFTAW